MRGNSILRQNLHQSITAEMHFKINVSNNHVSVRCHDVDAILFVMAQTICLASNTML